MSRIREKKKGRLGMDPSTANGRLLKDILFSFICKLGLDKCYRCGIAVTRGTMSIEHKEPWLNSDEPAKLFFDLDNIAFSHLSCNSASCESAIKKYPSKYEYRRASRIKETAARKGNIAHNARRRELRKLKRLGGTS